MKILDQTLKGSKHEKNEDSLFVSKNIKGKNENYKLLMVMDGISSCKNADVLTKTCKEYLESLNSKKMFKETDEMFNLKSIKFINTFSMFASELKSGTTLAMAIIETNKKIVRTYNLGDSPIYLVRNNMLIPVYGDCSLPVHRIRDYNKTSNIIIDNKKLFIVKPNEEIQLLRKANENPQNCNVIMSSLPYKINLQPAHFFSFRYNLNDVLLLGSDGFLSNYIYQEFEKNYVNMAKQIKNGGQSILDSFIKINSHLTNDDSTGICVLF